MVKSKKGKCFGDWRITSCNPIKGGNSTVWTVQSVTGERKPCALKLLNQNRFQDPTENRYRRFIDEVNFVRNNPEPHILSILDYHLPDNPTETNRPWYVMPLAESVQSVLPVGEERLEYLIELLIPVAKTLGKLHQAGVAHRDIKPDNLLVFEGKLMLADFGLVDYPGKMAITLPMEQMGPALFIAPELIGNAGEANARPADVYSLAKTLWVLAVGHEWPPQGHLEIGDPRLRLSTHLPHPHSALMDRLLDTATCTDPDNRPSIDEFAEELNHWLSLLDPDPAIDVDESLQIRLTAVAERHLASASKKRELRESAKIASNSLIPAVKEFLRRLSAHMQVRIEWDSALVRPPPLKGEAEAMIVPLEDSVSDFRTRGGCHVERDDGTMIGVTIQVHIVTFNDRMTRFAVALLITTGEAKRTRGFSHGVLTIVGGSKLPAQTKRRLWIVNRGALYGSAELAGIFKRTCRELLAMFNTTVEEILLELQ